MTRVVWDAAGERQFEAGVDRGVLYPIGKTGVPWNGLTGFTESPTGGTAKPRYYDGMKIANPATPEEFAGTLEAYTYPDEFEACDGTAELSNGLSATYQNRLPFNLSYRTRIGNDLLGINRGYKIHLLYNLLAAPTSRGNTSLNAQPTPTVMSWALSAMPMIISGRRPTPHLVIDSTRTKPRLLSYIEDILYGSSTSSPRLPLPSELLGYFDDLKFLKVVQNSVTGLSRLVEADDADLMGYTDEGLYQAASDTRLTPTGQPGIYSLDQ